MLGYALYFRMVVHQTLHLCDFNTANVFFLCAHVMTETACAPVEHYIYCYLCSMQIAYGFVYYKFDVELTLSILPIRAEYVKYPILKIKYAP